MKTTFPSIPGKTENSTPMNRRTFVKSGLAASLLGVADVLGNDREAATERAVFVAAGTDRFGTPISSRMPIYSKVSGTDNSGGLYVFEHLALPKGGPFRHMHLKQDEWFYVVSGEFAFEIGDAAFRLRRGDSIYAPRLVPHVWASVGDEPGGLILAVTPAGRLQQFFEAQAKLAGATSRAELESLFSEHEMQLVGDPLAVE